MKNIKIDCTWGDGPDVLLSLKGKSMLLHQSPTNKDSTKYGIVSKASMDLTADEALDLASALQMQAMEAKELEQQCKDHDEYMENHE